MAVKISLQKIIIPIVFFIQLVIFAQPANDICANALLINVPTSGTFSVNVDTTTATDSGVVNYCGYVNTVNKDQWYKITMPVNGNIKITGTNYYDSFALYSVCGGTMIDCFSRDGFFESLTAGTLYYLRFYNPYNNTRSGTFDIQAFESISNDNCSNSFDINSLNTFGALSSTQVSLNTNGATSSGEVSTCENVNNIYFDQWYTFTMPVNGNIKINGANYYDIFTLFDACSGNEITCFSQYGFYYSLTAGTTYTLRVSSLYLHARTGTFNIQAFQEVSNNYCSNPVNISGLNATSITLVYRDTNGATDSGITSACENANYDNLDQWYIFTMPVNGNIKITNASYYDKFTLFDVCNGNEIDCFSQNGFFYSLTAGTIYTLKVSNDSYHPQSGTFNMQAFQEVSNNYCSNPVNISNLNTTSKTTVDRDTNGATDSGIFSACVDANYVNLDQWYIFTMPVNGNIKITNASYYDKFTLFDACNGNEIDCFSNFGFFYSLTAGTVYTLKVSNDSYHVQSGTFKIQAFQEVSNNDCVNSENINVTTTSATIVNVDTNGATYSGTNSTCENLSYNYVDQWFSFVMPVSGHIQISGANYYDYYTLFTDCGGTEIACFPRNNTFYNLTGGLTYKLRLSNNVSKTRTGTFNIQAIETATNDLCTQAINLSVGLYDEYKETKTLFGASASGASNPTCGVIGSGEDVWFTVIVPASGNLVIETEQVSGSSLSDTVLQVFSGDCNALVEIACDDNSGDNNFSKISFTGLNPTDILYIRLFENGSDVADYFSIMTYDNSCTSKTSWTGTAWTNGVPDNTTIAHFKGNYSADTASIDACLCKIDQSVIVDVNSNQYINVENEVINNGILNINHQGSFVQVNETAQLLGTGTYKAVIKTTQLQDTNRFTYIASPVQSSYLSVMNGWAKMNYIWNFNGTTQSWNHIPNTNTIMIPGLGYAMQGRADGDYTIPFFGTTNFTGKFNNGVLSQPLYFNAGGIDDDNALVGNPYPSAISISALLNNVVNPEAESVYVWTHASQLLSTGYENDDYITCSSTVCTSAYVGNDTNNLNGYLASGQGFFVSTNAGGGNLVFKNTMRVTGNNLDFRSTNDISETIWLNLSSNLGYFNQIAISFSNNGTPNYDSKIDALRLGDYYGLGFYTLLPDSKRLAIDDRGLFSNEMSIPVGFYLNDSQVTNLKISIDHFENLDNTQVYLKDNLLQSLHDLKQSDYHFDISETGILNNRFEVVFIKNALSVNNEILLDNFLSVYRNIDELFEISSNVNLKHIEIYDIVGKLLFEEKVNTNWLKVNLKVNQGAVLLFKAEQQNGKILYKKVLVK